MTHAFFKALLFLGAGSVIHALHEEQDIRKMGGLRRQLPVTFATFLVATLAITGFPGLSGFFSKDEILAAAFQQHPLLWAIGLVTAGLTSFYMFRLLFLTFFGASRLSAERAAHVHESPRVMTLPLAILALLSVVGGWVGLPPVLGPHLLGGPEGGFLGPVFADLHHVPSAGHGGHLSHAAEWALMGTSTLVALAGFLGAWRRYGRPGAPAPAAAPARRWQRLLADKYRIDELYDALIVRPLGGRRAVPLALDRRDPHRRPRQLLGPGRARRAARSCGSSRRATSRPTPSSWCWASSSCCSGCWPKGEGCSIPGS